MRVLHFFKTYWPDTFGGVERSIHAIATGTVRHGVETDVLSLSRDPQANSKVFDGHMAWKAKLDFELASTSFSRDVFRHFRRLAEEADIIHYHFPWPLMDLVHLTKAPKKPALVTYHSDIVKQRLLGRTYAPLMWCFIGAMKAVVATSPQYLQTSPVLKQVNPRKAMVIPLGLDEADYDVSDQAVLDCWRARLPQPFFLFLGVLRYYKGLHYLIEAARLTGLPVVIAGDGPLAVELRAQVQSQKIENVTFLGSVSEADKVALLKLCTAFVFPSHLRSEAFGLSLVEAAMFSRPMISCEVGSGSSYVNKHEETGLVVAPGSAEALGHAMQQLFRDPDLCAFYGKNARKRYKERFTARQMADSYYALYQSLIA